jgi:hypothetical protein
VGLDLLAIDTETTGVDWHDEAFMISIASYDSDDGALRTEVYDRRICDEEKWQCEYGGLVC